MRGVLFFVIATNALAAINGQCSVNEKLRYHI